LGMAHCSIGEADNAHILWWTVAYPCDGGGKLPDFRLQGPRRRPFHVKDRNKYRVDALSDSRRSRSLLGWRPACYNICCYSVSMVIELKLRKIGNSAGLVLPKEALVHLNTGEGDALYLTDTTDGGFRLTASNPGFARKMKVAEGISRRYRHALRELAK